MKGIVMNNYNEFVSYLDNLAADYNLYIYCEAEGKRVFDCTVSLGDVYLEDDMLTVSRWDLQFDIPLTEVVKDENEFTGEEVFIINPGGLFKFLIS